MPEERKLVSILFADVTGSTALGETLELDDFRALMARYYDHARRVVEDHGGALEKFIGDAIVAVFGLPQAHSNDAERALAAALTLRDVVAADPVLAGHLTLRMGVNTGPVMTTITGDVRHGDFLVTGDAVNVAARLEQHASPGEILASERTAAAAAASFVFGHARSIEVKGKSQPLRVFALSAARLARKLDRPPLVGRKRELARLGQMGERARRARYPQLVAIVAPAGTGKTRLVEEFLARQAEAGDWRVATARCMPYGQTLTYWPLRGLLNELLGAPFSLEALSAVFAGSGYTPDDARRLAGLILTTLGAETEGQAEGQAERDELLNTWLLLFEALAKDAPRIVVFEDLHWASPSLLDLVENLMRPGASAALLIIVTSRPELLDRRPAWDGGRSGFTALALEPLSVADTRALVGKLAKKAPEATRALIAERSGGNPFFAIELTRGLNGERVTPDSLPDTVQEAVQERLDALAPRERAVLQAAAVAGRSFRSATLQAALTTQAPAEVETALENLQARDLIAPAADGAYAFRHILIRDVAYGVLSRAERIRLHLVVARWLEDFAAGRLDEFVELIAYHYSQAAQLARQSAIPLDTPVDAARAVEYLERAAALASQTGALIEARGHLERAISLAPEAEHGRLYEALGDRSGVLSDVAVPAYREALALWRAEARPDPLHGARLMRKLAVHIMRWHGGLSPDSAQRAEMVGWRELARRLAEQAGDEYEQWRLRAADLFWYWWISENPGDEAAEVLAAGWEAAGFFDARGDWDACSEALDGYGTLSYMLGDWDAVYAAAKRRLAAPALSAFERMDAMNTIVWAQSDRGDYAAAITTVGDLLGQRRPGQLATAFASVVFAAREDAYWSGRWTDFARFDPVLAEMWEEARGKPEDPRMLRLWQGDYIYTLLIAVAREDRAAAGRAAATLAQLAEWDHRDDRRQAFAHWIEAALHDDPTPLEVELNKITTRADLLLSPSYTSMCRFLSERGRPIPRRLLELISAGRAMRTADNLRRWREIARALVDDDNAALAQAIDEAEAGDLLPHAARMRIILAQRTGDRERLARARPILERLGDRQFLRRLEAVAAALG